MNVLLLALLSFWLKWGYTFFWDRLVPPFGINCLMVQVDPADGMHKSTAHQSCFVFLGVIYPLYKDDWLFVSRSQPPWPLWPCSALVTLVCAAFSRVKTSTIVVQGSLSRHGTRLGYLACWQTQSQRQVGWCAGRESNLGRSHCRGMFHRPTKPHWFWDHKLAFCLVRQWCLFFTESTKNTQNMFIHHSWH